MIPKIIHYCWFGRGEKSLLVKRCIESWKKVLSDYEIKEWNEDNFDLNSTIWTRQAYEAKKYAFVADYVRLYALYYEGGIYMDTDVEVLKSYNSLLEAPAFSGFEGDKIQTATLGSEKGGMWVKEMLDYYTDRPYLLADGKPEPITNVGVISNMMQKHGYKPNNQFQISGGLHIYPEDYFCPKSQLTLAVTLTKNTYCIHHFDGSWFPKHVRWRKKIRSYLPVSFYLWLRKIFVK